ncbi:DUF6232 family protein [Streptomyces sp. NPDC002138]|uniref:DUF6232 family protein n=1 Tax=Streptomyces sp. NPDC002138 TaxID=3154410 RepID=UPI00331FEE90
MDSAGNVGAPPPPPAPPAPPHAPPPQESTTSGGRRRLVLRVSGRMLWVGSAALPLHNITLVDAFRFRPSRWDAFVSSLKWLFGAVLLLAALAYVRQGDLITGRNSATLLPLALISVVVLALAALFRASKPVLAIETAGGSMIIVTLPNMDELRHIAAQIVYAIDHPEAEFTAIVHQTNHYAPVVNMNGGRGNTGIRL